MPGYAVPTLPFRVDPWSWVFTIPMTAALVWLYFQPSDHVLKRLWMSMARSQTQAWAGLFRLHLKEGHGRPGVLEKCLFWTLIFVLTAGSLACLAVFSGLAKNPTPQWMENMPSPNPEDVEIVIEGHAIRARETVTPLQNDQQKAEQVRLSTRPEPESDGN